MSANVIETRDVLDRRQTYFVVEGLDTLGVCCYEHRRLICLACPGSGPGNECEHLRAVATRDHLPEAAGLSGDSYKAPNPAWFD